MYKIYIVEDEIKLKLELKDLLTSYDYEVMVSDDFDNIVENILSSNSDLVLLDINLPKYDGYHICKQLRKVSNIPIIIVTSRNTQIDELMSMNLGADDFVTKPYNTQILLSRINALLNRAYGNKVETILEYNLVKLDIIQGILYYKNEKIELTKNETKILYLLMKNSGKIVTRETIMNELWQSEEFIDENTLTVGINRLRKKLEEYDLKDFLITKRGKGYMV